MTEKTAKIAPSTVTTTARFAVPDTDLTLEIDHGGSGDYSACVGDYSLVTDTITAPTLTRAIRDLRAHIKATNYSSFIGAHKTTVLVFLENSFTLKPAKPAKTE